VTRQAQHRIRVACAYSFAGLRHFLFGSTVE